MPIKPVTFLLLLTTALSGIIIPFKANALPDLNDVSADGIEYEMDMKHGNPFRTPYNKTLNPDNPTRLPRVHNTAHDYYLFEPRRLDGAPTRPRPVIVFFHGANLFPHPINYKDVITYFVGTGHTVVWMPFCTRGYNPRNFKTSKLCLDFVNYIDNAKKALMDAYSTLQQDDHVGIAYGDNGRAEVSFVSHSLGSHVAANLAGILGQEDGNSNHLPAPQSLILYDGAGNESTISEVAESLSLPDGVINAVFDILKTNGWSWTDPNTGEISDEIKYAIPLNKPILNRIPRRTVLLILGAKVSEGAANVVETVRRIYHWSASNTKLAYIVPHQCVQEIKGVLSYDCPSSLRRSMHTPKKHFYYITHSKFGRTYNRLTAAGVWSQTLACVVEGNTGNINPFCSGASSTYSGTWHENGEDIRVADPKYLWPLSPVP